ncbi:MAG TPA: hypothetical protein PLC98_24100 [Anaerolineales bacterium]|nr:hypothetical protein [Anaerolineales bacterium]
MALVLSAIAAGGLVGAANQYACLLVVAIAARAGLVTLSGPMAFMGDWWFIGVTAVLWLISVAPSFSQHLAPGVMHVVNWLTHFINGFVVPVSSALIGLAAAGVIVNLDPNFQFLYETLQIFSTDGGLTGQGLAVAGGSAAAAVTLTAVKGLAKPMISTGTGTAGSVSAPAFTVAENIAAVVLMGLTYILSQIDPRLLIGLAVVVLLFSLALLGYGLYQLYRLKKGVGRVLALAQRDPRAGLAVSAEFAIWGVGWLTYGHYGRAVISLCVWALWLALFVAAQGAVTALLAVAPPLIPLGIVIVNVALLGIFFLIGTASARALLQEVERATPLRTVAASA